jgi:WD40 repeat protein
MPLTPTVMAVDPEGKYVAVMDGGQRLRMCEIAGKKWIPVGDRELLVESFAFTPDGNSLVIGHPKSVVVRDLKSGKARLEIEVKSPPKCIALSPCGKYLACAGPEGIIELRDMATGKLEHAYTRRSQITALLFTPDSTQLLSASRDGIVRVMNVVGNRNVPNGPEPGVVSVLHAQRQAVESLAISADGTKVISASADKTIRVWDRKARQHAYAWETRSPTDRAIFRFIDNDRVLVVCDGLPGQAAFVKEFDVKTGKEGRSFEVGTGVIRSAELSPDGKILACADGKSIRLWNFATKQELPSLPGHRDLIEKIVFSPDSKFLVSGGRDSRVKVWEIDTGKQIAEFAKHKGWILALAISPDGQYVASGSNDPNIQIWQLQTGKAITQLDGHHGSITSLLFHPEQNQLFSQSRDRSLRVWECHTWTGKRTIENIGPNGDIVLSKHDQRLGVPSTNGMIALISMQTWNNKISISANSRCLAFSPDGQLFASCDHLGAVRVWQAPRVVK